MFPDLAALARMALWLVSLAFGGAGMAMLTVAWLTNGPLPLVQAGLCLAIAMAIVYSGALR